MQPKMSQMSNDDHTPQVEEAREAFHTLMEISRLLNTGLDQETLLLCVRLCEAGVNPDALALIVKEIRRECEGVTEDNARIR